MTHSSHDTVITDASSYDERCTRCGATDRWCPDLGSTLLDRPCSNPKPIPPDSNRLVCPKNPKHKIYEAEVTLRGRVLVSPDGEILSPLIIGPDEQELTITDYKPQQCGVCQTRL
jgi:hypothetical protein